MVHCNRCEKGILIRNLWKERIWGFHMLVVVTGTQGVKVQGGILGGSVKWICWICWVVYCEIHHPI